MLNKLGHQTFSQKHFQLHSVAVGGTSENDFYVGFLELAPGIEPLKEGNGPRGKNIVFSIRTRELLSRRLVCPHAAKLHSGELWVRDSGCGMACYVDDFDNRGFRQTRYVWVGCAPSFTRSMAFAGDHANADLSNVLEQHASYNFSLDETRCEVWTFDWRTGKTVATLSWRKDYWIYDVRALPRIKDSRLPPASSALDSMNHYLRFLA